MNADEHQELRKAISLEIEEIALEIHEMEIYDQQVFIRIMCVLFNFYPKNQLEVLFVNNTIIRNKIDTILQKEVIKNHTYDLNMEAKYIARCFRKRHRVHIDLVEDILYSILISKGLQAYLYFYDEDYKKSMWLSRWCVQFHYFIRKYNIELSGGYDFLDDSERFFSILCSKCVIHCLEDKYRTLTIEQVTNSNIGFNKTLNALMYSIIENTDPELMTHKDSVDKLVLCNIFETLGDIHEKISIFEGSLLNCETKEFIYYDIGIKLEKRHLVEMIRKHILALTLRPIGDPYVINILNKILVGLILHGGFHCEIINIFYYVRKYCSEKYNLNIKESYRSSRYKECLDMVDEILEEWEKLQPHCTPRTIQLPQIIIQNLEKSTTLIYQSITGSSKEHAHDVTMFLSALKAKLKQKFIYKINFEDFNSQLLWETGVEIIKFWELCYIDNVGAFPKEFSSLVHLLC